jgi:hypothetical protein
MNRILGERLAEILLSENMQHGFPDGMKALPVDTLNHLQKTYDMAIVWCFPMM